MRRLVVGGVSAVTLAGVGVVGLSVPASATSTFSVSRLAGPDRFATAAAIATAAYPKGAATVILASGLAANISDSLAASYLAGQLNGGAGAPILLTNPTSLPASTIAALKTLGATHVIVVGGSAAVADSIIATLSAGPYNLSVTRVAGPNRFATSMALDTVSGHMTVGTAGGASPAAAASTTNGVTLTNPAVVPGGTVNGILANPSSVSALTVSGAGLANQALTVNATTGAFSFVVPSNTPAGADTLVFTATPSNGTAATQGTVVLTVNPANGSTVSGQKFAIVADGQNANLVDSLGSAPVAFANHFPILLVNGPMGTLSAAQLAFLKSEGISSDVLVVGGTAAVGTQVYSQLVNNGQTPINVAGTNRSATSMALADFAINNFGFSTTTFDIASGAQGHLIDSLSGGPYGGTRTPPAPTLITASVTDPGNVTAFASEHAGTEQSAVIFGGTAAVDTTVRIEVTAAGQVAAPLTAGSVTTTTTSVPIGGTVSGLVTTPALVKTVTVSGCGLSSAPVTFSSTTGAFVFTIPSTQGAGTCTLTYTATLLSGATLTSTASITVTTPVPVVPVSGATTGLGTPPVAGEDAPVLTGAAITANNFKGLSPSIVQFTFSQPVTPNKADLADFALQGYNVGRPSAHPISVSEDAANPNVIDAAYPPSVDVASYTIAVVDNDATPAVRGNSGVGAGLGAPLGSVPLSGSTGPSSTTTGSTTAPDLVSATVNPANNHQVFYTFDKPVESITNPTGFGYNKVPGIVGSISAALTPGSDTVTATFAGSAALASNFFVDQGAVQGAAAGSGGANPTGAVDTSGLYLTGITPVSGNAFEYNFVFNQAVGAGPASDYQLFLNNASEISGSTVVATNGNTVTVDFSPTLTAANAADVTLGAVVKGAAHNIPSGLVNDVSAAPISGLLVNGGLTDGPDLQSAVANTALRTVTYTFNQAITFPKASAYFVINAAGAPTFASSVAVQGDTAVATFGAAIDTAVGAGVTNPRGLEAGNNSTGAFNANFEANAPGDVTLAP